MNRRNFIKIAGSATVAAAVYTLIPPVAHGVSTPVTASHDPEVRYMLHGNKRLGCAGCDFPADPEIIENGHFMPQM